MRKHLGVTLKRVAFSYTSRLFFQITQFRQNIRFRPYHNLGNQSEAYSHFQDISNSHVWCSILTNYRSNWRPKTTHPLLHPARGLTESTIKTALFHKKPDLQAKSSLFLESHSSCPSLLHPDGFDVEFCHE